MACTFSTSQLPKVLRDRRVLPLFTSKCASRHNGVQFLLSHLPRCLRTRRFSEPTFRPSGATKHWKNTVFRDFPTLSRTCIFFLPTFSISELLLICTAFSSLHIVGSLASKLPSTNCHCLCGQHCPNISRKCQAVCCNWLYISKIPCFQLPFSHSTCPFQPKKTWPIPLPQLALDSLDAPWTSWAPA